jgi:predicted unusual protein kinase regulating ubiquinone biosynthesis (AarF/ABC1/UbiB family)
VLARRLGRLALSHARGRPVSEEALARAVSLLFQDLGTTFVKFGQLVASSPGIFGEGFANQFRSCLDTGPVVPFDTVRAAVEERSAARSRRRSRPSRRRRSAARRSPSCTAPSCTTGASSP